MEIDEPVAALGSICGIQDRDEAEKLLAAANYDLQLCVYRLYHQQRQLQIGNAVSDPGYAIARTDSSGHEKTLVRMQALEVTVLGVNGLYYHRPGSTNNLLTNWLYTLIECDGSTALRTQPVRRSSRPHWYQAAIHPMCRDHESVNLRITLLDLGHNIIGSALYLASVAGAPRTVRVELLSTIDLPHNTQAVVGTLELRLRHVQPDVHTMERTRAQNCAVFGTQMGGSARRSDAINFSTPGLADQLTQLYINGLEKDLVQCPGCATRFSMVPGQPGDVVAGVGPMSKEAALDYSRHRVRCVECQLEFCTGCGQAPFHVGEASCQAAKQAKGTRSCRFCSKTLNSVLADQDSGWRRCTRIEDSWCSSRYTEDDQHRPLLVCRRLFADNQDADRHWAWRSKRWNQSRDEPQWLAFDLGEVCCVKKMRFKSTSISYTPKRYTVERSNVSVHGPWEVMYAFEDEREDIQSGALRERDFEKPDATERHIPPGSFSARWVRVVFHSTFGGSEVRIAHLHWFTSLPAIMDVCSDDACQRYAKASCDRMLPCGHSCCGIVGELNCLPCLRCLANGSTPIEFERNLREDAGMSEVELTVAATKFFDMQQQDTSSDEFCCCCWTDSLGAAPSITLRCGHTLHAHCVQQQVERGWPDGPIQFGFMECPACRQDMHHSLIDKELEPRFKLRKQVRRMAVEIAQAEHGGAEAVRLLADAAGEDVETYASRQSVFKQCWECKSPFFFAAAHCGGEAPALEEDREGIICRECEARNAAVETCDRHGTDHLMWKCRYCCTPATYECFGYAHFCNNCHEFPAIKELMNFDKPMVTGPTPYCKYEGNQYVNTKELWEYTPCKGCEDNGKSCPLGVAHARTGVEHCLGCTLCAVDRESASSLVKQLKAIVSIDEYNACQHRADERDYDKVRQELAANMMRNGGANGRDALLAGRLTKREAVLWMRDWGLGSGALARLGLKGKNPASVANAKTVEQIARGLECFVQHEAIQIPALADLLSRDERTAARLQALWRGHHTRKTTSQSLTECRAAIRLQKVWRGTLARSAK